MSTAAAGATPSRCILHGATGGAMPTSITAWPFRTRRTLRSISPRQSGITAPGNRQAMALNSVCWFQFRRRIQDAIHPLLGGETLGSLAQVDLSAYAGREVTLRLVTDPGPAHDTTCDQSYWAGPTIVAGPQSVPEPKAAQMQRRATALALAAAAQKGGTSAWSWKLESEAGLTGAAIAPGPRGLADAFIAFTDGSRTLVFDGFNIQVDGRNDLPSQSPDIHFDSGRGTITTRIPFDEGTVPVQVAIWAEKGVLRIAFSMPGVKRNFRGQPRFTSLAIGPASELAHRVYAGFGNVIQDPGAFIWPPAVSRFPPATLVSISPTAFPFSRPPMSFPIHSRSTRSSALTHWSPTTMPRSRWCHQCARPSPLRAYITPSPVSS